MDITTIAMDPLYFKRQYTAYTRVIKWVKKGFQIQDTLSTLIIKIYGGF